MARLAILGHATRGNEVVELLKMLGGKDEKGIYHGNYINYAYLITKYNFIDFVIDTSKILRGYKVFTLEDFLTRYPYRVGDKVLCGVIYGTITEMRWVADRDNILYTVKIHCGIVKAWASELSPITIIDTLTKTQQAVRESNENLGKVIEKLKREDMEKKIVREIILPDYYEYRDEDGNVVNVKKIVVYEKPPQYPKTYEQCCEVLGISVTSICEVEYEKYTERLYSLYQLLVCRDAYWQIAGDWQPNWKDFSTQKYSISVDKDEIITSHRVTGSRVLVFPTAEMRDIFYENFKDLINECKELL